MGGTGLAGLRTKRSSPAPRPAPAAPGAARSTGEGGPDANGLLESTGAGKPPMPAAVSAAGGAAKGKVGAGAPAVSATTALERRDRLEWRIPAPSKTEPVAEDIILLVVVVKGKGRPRETRQRGKETRKRRK